VVNVHKGDLKDKKAFYIFEYEGSQTLRNMLSVPHNVNNSDSEDDAFGDDGPRPLDWLKANMDPTTATGEKQQIDNNSDDSVNGQGKDEGDSDEGSGDDTNRDGEFQHEFVESFVSKRGNTFYRCKLCPSKGPFPTEKAALAFMKGKFFQKQLEKTRKLLKPIKKLTPEQKLALQIKKENRIEKLKVRRKEKRKAKNLKLTEDQIARKKAKFQAKKKRRLARKSNQTT
jgi:hypothetical protein